MKKLLIVTTVPETLATILKGQPSFLNSYYSVSLATSGGCELSEIIKCERIRPHIVPMKRGINPIKDILSLIVMVHVLIKVRPDAIHSYTPKAGLIAMLAAKLCRVPVRIHTFTGLIFPTQTGFKKKLLIYIDRLLSTFATKVIPEGRGVKDDLVKYKITSKPMGVIGYGNIAGVDTSFFSPQVEGLLESAGELRKKLGIERAAFVFCFVGRLNRDKGLSELASAFSALPAEAHLILVGSLDVSAPIDDDTLAALRDNSRIHVLGFLSDIRPALVAADTLVLPSYREGFPNTVLQAGAMMMPVIASDISGCNEVIEPEFNGWLIPPKNISSLQQTMKKAMLLSPEERLQMGKKARQRIQQRFEQSDHWRRMLDFYCLEIK